MQRPYQVVQVSYGFNVQEKLVTGVDPQTSTGTAIK